MKRGRPSSSSLIWEFHIHLRLREGDDDDLIAFLQRIPNRRRTSAIKAALRAGGMEDIHPETLDDDLILATDTFLK
ncbi:MAG: hypothetical protein WCK35_26220 [Chloroflexota bacterium]